MKKVLIIIAVVFVLVISLVVGVLVVRRFLNTPLADPLQIDTTPQEEVVLLPTEAAELDQGAGGDEGTAGNKDASTCGRCAGNMREYRQDQNPFGGG